MDRRFIGCAWVALGASVSACSGGSVRTAPPPPPSERPAIPPPTIVVPDPSTGSPGTGAVPPPPAAEDFELTNSNAAVLTGSPAAWARGITGSGVKIGFIDTGVNPALADIAANLDPGSRNIGGGSAMSDGYGHGTATASIAAGVRNKSGMVGVAPDARIVMIKVDKPGSCPEDCDFVDLADGVSAAVAAGAKVVNISLKSTPTSDLVDAVKSASQSGVIFVVAAANDADAQPSEFARAIASAANGRGMIVGGLGVGDYPNVDYSQLSAKSNAAGAFKDWFLTAPGRLISVAHETGVSKSSGTSFAAPAVSGAAALLLDAFPNLSPADLIQILLTTADDLGAVGVDAIYGHGKLNIGRAFQPIGSLALAGTATALDTINGTSPAAAGDALTSQSADAIALDSYARAFTVDLAKTVQQADAETPLAHAASISLQSSRATVGNLDVALATTTRDGTLQLGLADADVGPRNLPQLNSMVMASDLKRATAFAVSTGSRSSSLERNLSGLTAPSFLINQDVLEGVGITSQPKKAGAIRRKLNGLAVGASYEQGRVVTKVPTHATATYRIAGFSLEKRFLGLSVKASVKQLRESQSLLGGTLSHLFGRAGATTNFLEAEFRKPLMARLTLGGSIRRGWTGFDAGAVRTSAFGVDFTATGVDRSDDALTLRLSQPLRVQAGGMTLQLPTSYDYRSGRAGVSASAVSLVPSGRELIAEIGYSRPLRAGALTLNAYARSNPGHSSSANADLGALAKLRIKF